MNEQLFTILGALLQEIRDRANTAGSFEIHLPAGNSLEGVVRFYRVRSVEDGFVAPEGALRTLCDLDTIEQWRG